jgi:hypothetical protein
LETVRDFAIHTVLQRATSFILFGCGRRPLQGGRGPAGAGSVCANARAGEPASEAESGNEVIEEVSPFGIALFDEAQLPLSFPSLHAFLSGNGILNSRERFEIHQSVDVVALGEACDLLAPMLITSTEKATQKSRMRTAAIASS